LVFWAFFFDTEKYKQQLFLKLDSKIQRAEITTLSVSELEEINPIQVLEQYILNRNMTATGIFKKLN
jgi:hypothetical protein